MATVEGLLQRGAELLTAGMLDEAAAALADATRASPGSADAWHLRGVTAYRRGELEHARECIELALTLAPETAAYRVNLGNVHRAAGAIAAAIDEFESALVLDPDNARVLCNLGNALGDAGDLASAIDAYHRAAAIDPTLGDAYQGLAWALTAAGRVAEVDAVHRAWASAAPDDPAARWLAATDTSPTAVAGYFDRFASTYDATLDAIDYVVPRELAALLPAADASWRVLDAGCGSGRAGELLRPYARVLVGADVSAAMLALAAERNVYDELVQRDAAALLHERAFDLLFAADVLPYIEDPSVLLHGARIVAFSVELAASADVERRTLGRFAHGEAFVHDVLRRAGLRVLEQRRRTLRREAGVPVEGLLVVATADTVAP